MSAEGKEGCSSHCRADLTLSTPAASASPASEQLAASSGTVLGPHNCELCYAAQALASAKFFILKCLLHQADKVMF